MIRNCFIFFLLILSVLPIFAQSSSDAQFIAINGYTNEPIPFLSLSVTPESGANALEMTTDSTGRFSVRGVSKYYGNRIFVQPHDDRFVSCYVDKASNVWSVKVYCYPSDKYEEEINRIEDSLYGSAMIDSVVKSLDSTQSASADFPGGVDSLRYYIGKNVVYPPLCLDNGLERKIRIYFIVEPNGKISHVTCNDPPNDEFVREAKRLIRAMPDWSPAKSIATNDPFRIRIYVPINFTIM